MTTVISCSRNNIVRRKIGSCYKVLGVAPASSGINCYWILLEQQQHWRSFSIDTKPGIGLDDHNEHDTTTNTSSTPSTTSKKTTTPPPPGSEQQQQQHQTTLRPDYLTNDGIIEGVWIFTRHGDRTPSRPLTPAHRIGEEAEFWLTKLPLPSTIHVYKSFCGRYPIRVENQGSTSSSNINNNNNNTSDDNVNDNDNKEDSEEDGDDDNNQNNKNTWSRRSRAGMFNDGGRFPFGFLTDIGLQQLWENGRRFFNRYHTIDSTRSKKNTNNIEEIQRNNQEFLSLWNIQVYSTNYLRTILSVQSFLDGMFNIKAHQTMKDIYIKNQQRQTYAYNEFHKKVGNPRDLDLLTKLEIPNHTWPLHVLVENDKHYYYNNTNAHRVKAVKSNEYELLLPQPIPITVRALKRDPINSFNRSSMLIHDLVDEVWTNPHFVKRDSDAAPLAARLAIVLPGLARSKQKLIKNLVDRTMKRRRCHQQKQQEHDSSTGIIEQKLDSTSTSINHNPLDYRKFSDMPATAKTIVDFAAKTPSGINWVEACDHFVCRTAHNVPLTKFLGHEHHGDQLEHTLQAMANQSMTHLTWRYRQWYFHRPLLACIAAPALREVTDNIKNEINTIQQRSVPTTTTTILPSNSSSSSNTTSTGERRKPFVLYCCHDVTILGLLYGIGADFLIDDLDDRGAEKWRYWPPYGSTLVFELVRTTIPLASSLACTEDRTEDYTTSQSSTTTITSGSQSASISPYLIRVLLNGKPVVSVDIQRTNEEKVLHYLGSGPHNMLRIDELDNIVSQLEHDGGDNAKI